MSAKAPPKCPQPADHPLLAKVKEALGGAVLSHGVTPEGHLCVMVPAAKIRDVANAVKSMGFDHVLSLSAVDYVGEKKFLVMYVFASYLSPELKNQLLHVRAEIPRDDPKIASIADIFPSADYEERECHEMFGIWFEGNPHMGKRFLLDPDCCIDEKTGKPLYPLRKDFKVPDWGLMG
ncbi:NADH-quinone oxidoreductase subunit C [Pyrobaculum calidifontis]|uniref:NADH dehydrogenase subunit C n=1 Tax=Pyrobaculum calidifontis (strain DSM 21063 / JCM 11548 / VA1) TaxID=410359 RepID=A3MXK5_PYRCJ|nr:NADH-quinone oxidoreductase subunit C [Pyrobaculum calidifontis]ABO09372.1 NADH dehydrogenase subunit C [Pyrobaculum calidifontis JCM 11548]